MTRSALTFAILALALAVAPLGRAALPPGYGGTIRVASSEPLRLPEPAQARSLVEATLADAVFDPLDSLGVAPPEVVDGDLRFTLRDGLRRHDRRPVLARDVVAHLRRLHQGPGAHWLAPLREERGRPVAVAEDERRLSLAPADPGADLRPLLALRPLAFRAAVGTGTGPYRPRMVGSELRLFQFRAAARGAPYIRDWRFLAPRPRDEDLRALVLGEVDASFAGGSLHARRPQRPVRGHDFPEVAPVLLVPNPHRVRGEWARVVGLVDRDRLARVGLRPSDRLAVDLEPPTQAVGAAPPSRAIVFLTPAGDRLGEELGRALAAIFDAAGARLVVETAPLERWSEVVHRGRWDLRWVEVPPPLPGTHPLASTALLVAAQAAVGDGIGAASTWRGALAGTLDAETRQRTARSLPALMLGMRRLSIHLDEELGGVGFDEAGRLRLGDPHLPRARTGS
ncbi:MAG: hypothetical protein CMN30_09720 [Sandaracinus sp.]|nr:hypothetical protein [Sandaracinus sp.]MAQ15057.1 hypothetical protein [Sandaracinus sp.]